jgi:hypothetical protein
MKKIAVLFLLCLLVPAVSACAPELASASGVEAPVDVMEIKTHAGKLVEFIDKFTAHIEDFKESSRTDAPELCQKMELLYHEFKAETPPGELVPAQERVLERARVYLDGAWDWIVSEEKPEAEAKEQLGEAFLNGGRLAGTSD